MTDHRRMFRDSKFVAVARNLVYNIYDVAASLEPSDVLYPLHPFSLFCSGTYSFAESTGFQNAKRPRVVKRIRAESHYLSLRAIPTARLLQTTPDVKRPLRKILVLHTSIYDKMETSAT